MIRKRREYAAIAQSVERILGKDEVASSNLASSSKASGTFGFQRFFSALLRKKILNFSVLKNTVRPHPFLSLLDEGMRSYFGQKNHNEWTHWTVRGGGVPGFYFG